MTTEMLVSAPLARMDSATAPQQSATDWLRQALFAGPADSAHVKALAERAGIGTKALRNAREGLGVVCSRQGNGSAMHSTWSLQVETCTCLQADAESIRAPTSPTTALLTIVKVPSEVSNSTDPAIRAANSTTRVSLEAGHPGRTEAHVSDYQMLSLAKVGAHLLQHDAIAKITDAEVGRANRNLKLFASRGIGAAEGGELAIRLVVDRDRSNSKEGSCIECQCLRGASCAPGDQGHTAGPRPPGEVWMCWCARRE